LSAPGEVPFEIEYYRGIKKAYSERGLDSGTCRFVNCIPSIESGMDAILEQYRSYKTEIGQAFTGVMAFCDMLAFGAYKAAAKLGLRIPHDLSVIGYDNIPFAAMATPPLTTIDFPVVRIAEYCSEILLSCLVRGERNVMRYILEPSLVERGSTARAGGGL
jgi:DNA-binding LacI/PurR family transcriptional regulator